MGEATRIELLVAGLRCSGEAPVLSRKLERIPGVVQAYANPVTEIAYIDILPDDFSLEEAVHVIRRFGCRATVLTPRPRGRRSWATTPDSGARSDG